MLVVDPTLLTVESLARAAVILAVGLLLLVSSIIIIVVQLSNRSLYDCIGYFIISLSCSDLVVAICIVPLSMYSSLSPEWQFFHDNSAICKVSAYLQVVVLSSTIYTFAWVAVDRYSAFKKPSRYESDHTLTRCKCWIAFSWVTAILISCPIIITRMEVNYYPEFELCVLNWSSTTAYSLTLGVLVIGPVICTIIFTASSVMSDLQRPEELDDVQRTIIDNDRNFVLAVFTFVSFFVSWLPTIILHVLPSTITNSLDLSPLKFAFMWFAIGCNSSKLIILFFTKTEFRRSFCALCTGTTYNENVYGNADFVSCCVPEERSCLFNTFCFLCCGWCYCWQKVFGRYDSQIIVNPTATNATTATAQALIGSAAITTNAIVNNNIPDYRYESNTSPLAVNTTDDHLFSQHHHAAQQLYGGYHRVNHHPPQPQPPPQQQATLAPHTMLNSRSNPEYGSFTRFATGYA